MVSAKQQFQNKANSYFDKKLTCTKDKKLMWMINRDKQTYYLELAIDKNSSSQALQFKVVMYKAPIGEKMYDMFKRNTYTPKWSLLKKVNAENVDNVPAMYQKQLRWLYYWNNRPWVIVYAGKHMAGVTDVVFASAYKKFISYSQ